MKRIPALINKDTLRFIVEGKKVSDEYILKSCKFKPLLLQEWLDTSSETYPVITQAKKIASCLHIPFAALYMNKADINLKSIPKITNFRTFQDAETLDDSLLNITVLDMINERDFLVEARSQLEICSETFNAKIPSSDDPIVWANAIRQFFSIEISNQYSCKNSGEFYIYLRSKIEEKGIFVYCFNGIDVETIRGMAICDDIMPMIGINLKDRYPAKIFSIIHELVHIYKRHSSFCNEMQNNATKQEEIFCNAVAGELLVPTSEMHNLLIDANADIINYAMVNSFANKFSVSKDVIVRRLFDLKIITYEQYNEFNEKIKNELNKTPASNERTNGKSGKKNKSKNMYKTVISKTSSSICKVLYEGYCRGIYDDIDISNYLGLDISQVKRFIQEVEKWDS